MTYVRRSKILPSPGPVKYEWVTVKRSFCIYQQCRWQMGEHFIDLWFQYE